jgi:hypothetical protein
VTTIFAVLAIIPVVSMAWKNTADSREQGYNAY